ncbi:hypothetical protein IIO_04053 [Bacillus cereus VD115]|nr:hypothetical protein IIO_04053 [Bacillus cereus VD115]
MFKKKFLPVLVGAILFASLVPTSSFARESSITKVEQKNENEMFDHSKKILQAIEEIPDDVVNQGPQQTAEWLQTKTGYYVTVDSQENLNFTKGVKTNTSKRASFSGCLGAVGVAIVSNGLPFSKILKVKSALKALGGTTQAVSKIKKYYDSYRYNGFSRSDSIRKALNSAGDGLAANTKSALLDFFNLSNVIANCF